MVMGIIIIAVGFITGISLAIDVYDNFSIEIALYWWLPAVATGVLFIGLSEVIHLLQRLLDRSAAAPLEAERAGVSRAIAQGERGIGAAGGADEAAFPKPAEQFKGLTILLDDLKVKGAFRMGADTLQIVRQSMFQRDADAESVATIPLDSISRDYAEEGEYFVFTFDRGTRKLAFKTPNLYDYGPIVKKLRRET